MLIMKNMYTKIAAITCFQLLSLCFDAKAQIAECDYGDRDSVNFQQLPYFDNNDMLATFLDSMGYPSPNARISSSSRIWYRVPVAFWVYRDGAGNGGPSPEQIQAYLDNLNNFYNVVNDTKIGFYSACAVRYVNNSANNTVTNIEAAAIATTNRVNGHLNIHIVNNLVGAIGMYLQLFDAVFLNSETYSNLTLRGTIAHEAGHYFGLDHTHQYDSRSRCLKEAIDRNRTWPTFSLCLTRLLGRNISESTGDGLRDTPADPELTANQSCVFNFNGNYTASLDPWGDSYAAPPPGSSQPSTINLMNYITPRSCRTNFTRLQIAVMLRTIVRGRLQQWESRWRDQRVVYDTYEMDNEVAYARPITASEIQEHSFHLNLRPDLLGSDFESCDVDWVRFTAPCSITLNIETSELAPFFNLKANTRLTIFNSTGTTQLGQNDNISATNLYSRLSFNFVAGTTYLIRVDNMSPGDIGYYQLRLTRIDQTLSISGPNTICTTASYSVLNMPGGSTVQWQTSNPDIVSISGSTSPMTASRINSGTIDLVALVAVPVCGTNVNTSVTKQIRAGGYSSGDYPISGPSSVCRNQVTAFSAPNLLGATNYTWTWPTAWTLPAGQGTPNLSIRSPNTTGAGAITVRVANACDLGGSVATRTVTVNNCGSSFRVSPNPTTNTLTLESVSDPTAKVSVENNLRIQQIRITDVSGNLRMENRFSEKPLRTIINVTQLRPGNYNILIFDGSGWASIPFIKQ
jgi:hypothetical protein